MVNDVWRQYKRDKEWMVAEPAGYVKLAHWLAQDLPDVRVNAVVERIEYNAQGVAVHLRDGSIVQGSPFIFPSFCSHATFQVHWPWSPCL